MKENIMTNHYIDLTSLVVDNATYKKIMSGTFNVKKFLIRLIEDDVIQIVNTDDADYEEALDLKKYMEEDNG
jgi:hypothetical protein